MVVTGDVVDHPLIPTAMPLVEIQNLQLDLIVEAGRVRVLDGVDLSIGQGSVHALVGESGSGKSLTAMSLARLLPEGFAQRVGGRVVVDGRDVFGLGAAGLRELRGGVVSYVFQEPATALNPVMRVGDQILETLRIHRPAQATPAEVVGWLQRVGIPAPEVRARQYPQELSGGMQQRVMIAMALAPRPRLLVADEPTTALDVTIQAQILELLMDLRCELGMTILLITHNLGVVAEIADELSVMYAGQVVETGPAAAVLKDPSHPYTQALLASVPRLGARHQVLASIPGTVPPAGSPPTGCRFHPRCPVAAPVCRVEVPLPKWMGGGRAVRCPFAVDRSVAGKGAA
jgi:oligopeptide/dipeptide ABC transporter ATP-binding protein